MVGGDEGDLSAGQALPQRLALLRAELEANAEKSFSPRFWAKEVA